MPIEEAVKKPPQIVCWGERFNTLLELSKDPRCRITYVKMVQNLSKGMTLEQATLNFYECEYPITINHVIKQRRLK
jgi:hypothetical protein